MASSPLLPLSPGTIASVGGIATPSRWSVGITSPSIVSFVGLVVATTPDVASTPISFNIVSLVVYTTPGVAGTSIASPGIAAIIVTSNSVLRALKVRICLELQVLARLSLRDKLFQEFRNLLLSLEKGAGQNASKRLIAVRVKGRSKTAVANATSTSCFDSVSI